MAEPRDWFPAGALTDDHIGRIFGVSLDDWAQAYLPTASVELRVQAEKRLSSGTEAVRTSGKGSWISVSEAGRQALLSAALGDAATDKTLTEADRRLLGAVTEKLVADLLQRIEALLPQASSTGRELKLDLRLTGRDIGTIGVLRQAVIALLKGSLRGNGKKGRPVTRRSAALASITVTIEAAIGNAALTMDDVRGLAMGDVLLLDRSLAEGADIRIDGSDAAFARGEFSTDRGRNNLVIAAP